MIKDDEEITEWKFADTFPNPDIKFESESGDTSGSDDEEVISDMRKDIESKRQEKRLQHSTIDVDTLPLSKELLEREQLYIEMNKQLQSKSAQIVKLADAVMKEGKQTLHRPSTTPPTTFAIAAESLCLSPAIGSKSLQIHRAERKLKISKDGDLTSRISAMAESLTGDDDVESVEVTTRILKAKVTVMQQELNKLLSERSVKDTATAIVEERLKIVEEEKVKISKNFNSLQLQFDKMKIYNEELKKKNDDSESEIISLRKNLESITKTSRQSESDVNAKDVRLNRALEEIERYKQISAKTNSEAKEKLETAKLNSDKLYLELKRLEKQKADLLLAFKKQMQLIDVLKRQKMHLEATRILEFTEEEFMRALK
ncbi:Golgin sub A member 2 [Nowakowskiella sp. JEL0078]|nr:Golgin sub A member 2 [Nowakowskiella sp. JEL0078]